MYDLTVSWMWIRSKQQQRGTPPINYQLRNRQRIKEIQRQYQCEAQSNIERELQDQRLAHKKLHRFGSIPSRLHSAVSLFLQMLWIHLTHLLYGKDIKRTEERNCAIYRDDAKKNDATKSNGRMRDVKVDKAISPPKSRAIGKVIRAKVRSLFTILSLGTSKWWTWTIWCQ